MKPENETARSAGGANGLDGHYVTSAEVFALETEKIFSRNWICIARAEELDVSGQCLPIEIGDHRLFVARNDSATGIHFKTFRNFCRHRGSQLVNEQNCSAIGQRIQCPYHAWTYERDGRLVAAPNMAGVDGFDLADHGLIEIPTEVFGGFIWINFNPTSSLVDWIAPISDRFDDWSVADLKVAHEIRYDVAANWKLIFQNYSECYHCPTVHPMLNRLTPFQGSSNDLSEGPILGGPMSLADGSQTMSCDGKLAGDLLPGLNDSQTKSVHYFTLFPTMFLSLHPDYVLIHRLLRNDPGNTTVICQFLFHPDSQARSDFDAG